MNGAEGSKDWVEAGFDALAQGGVDRVRVEVLAERLGVPGWLPPVPRSPALLAAMLGAWPGADRPSAGDQLDGRRPRRRFQSPFSGA
jgi:hypothetical protein